MSKQAIIFEVSDRSFDKYVVGNSNKAPVFVAFISTWSEPCIIMSDMLAGLAKSRPTTLILFMGTVLSVLVEIRISTMAL